MRALLFIFFLFQLSISFACDCNRIKDLAAAQERSYLTHELIFIGELIEVNDNGTYRFRIIELFKGESQDSVVVGQYLTSCSAFPDMTELTWLVYANPNENGIIDIYSCGLSRSFEFPFLNSDETGIPPPPTMLIEHAKSLDIESTEDYSQIKYGTDELLDHHRLMAEFKGRALEVLKKEIEQLRKQRDE